MQNENPTKTRRDAPQALYDLALKAQRQRWIRACVPASVRARLGGATATLMTQAATEMVDDWSAPLLGASQVPLGNVMMRTIPPRSAEADNLRSTRIDVTGTPLHRNAPRCLLVTCSLGVTGMAEMVAFLALRLQPYGFRTAVLIIPPTPEHDVESHLGPSLSEAGIEVVTAEESGAREWLREWAPDVVTAHEAPSWVLDEARSLAAPYVKVLHGTFSLFECDWTAEAEQSRDIAAIVAVSETVRQQYLRGVPAFPSERIVTISNGVNNHRHRPHDRSLARTALGLEDEFLFVCLARYGTQKNQFGLVSAFDEVAARHPEVHLLMAGEVGSPAYCRQVRQRKDRLVARDRVHMRDHVADPSFVLAAADGFVLNSFFEGGPLVTMEALHAGVPVVASDCGAVRDQLGADPTRGYLIRNPLGDPLEVNWATIGSACWADQINREELIEAMCALVREREQHAAKREDLAAQSAERFHPDRCVRAHADLLRACLDGATWTHGRAA